MGHQMRANSAGSLQVISNNEYTVSRGLFTVTMTLAYRNNALVLAGYTYADTDRHDLAYYSTCDANLLTGKGVLNTNSGNGTFEMNESISLEDTYFDSLVDTFDGENGYCSGFEFGENGDF